MPNQIEIARMPRIFIGGFRRAAVTLASAALAMSMLSAHAAWRWRAEIGRGEPGGVIQVRENAINGTTLPLGPRLGIDWVQRVGLAAVDEMGGGHALVFNLDFARLSGQTVFASPIYFNGAPLQAGKPLTTNASWLTNWQFTFLYRQTLWNDSSGAHLYDALGLTYVGLTYSLQGHPVGAASVSELSGSRTSEDFITQELPVPQVGLEFVYPLNALWAVHASVLGGHLPRVYSLRNEGGKVYVTQTNRELRWGLDYQWSSNLQAGFGWYDRYYMQNEQSAEDGNYIRMREHGIYLSVRYAFQQ